MDPIGSLVGWIAVYGACGLFAIGLAERFVPIIPSHAVLLAIGIAAAEGSLPLPASFLAISLGGIMGCAVCFLALATLGEIRASRLVEKGMQFVGMSAERTRHQMASMRRNGPMLAFSLQLVPTARFVAPPLLALLRGNRLPLLAASAAGIAVWNSLFIVAGYAASWSMGIAGATVLAAAVIASLLAAQAGLYVAVRRVRARRLVAVTTHTGI